MAYIRGIKEFHGVALAVDVRALVPRPETELLVDLALSELADVLGRAADGATLLPAARQKPRWDYDEETPLRDARGRARRPHAATAP